jgi:hypothetical protein
MMQVEVKAGLRVIAAKRRNKSSLVKRGTLSRSAVDVLWNRLR